MTVYVQDTDFTLHHGDVLDILPTLPDQSVNCCITSPPFYGLRDYGVDGQLGLEPTPDEYVARMVEVFREVRRVLRDDGTLWLNLGDSYARTQEGNVPQTKNRPVAFPTHSKRGSSDGAVGRGDRPGSRLGSGDLKPKDLVGIPWRVAFALQQPYYAGSIKDERDRIWLAATMDGEGCFTILQTTSPHGSGDSYPPIAQIRMTSEGVVGKAASIVGVASPAQTPPSAGGNRPVYQWRLSGSRAAAVARELYPYLIEKRAQALIAWNHQEVRDSYETKRGVKIPAAALEKQIHCRELIRRLNRGESVDIPSWMTEPPTMTEPGWYLRSDVIWSKPNPMPESVTDRPTKSHEYIFMLTKSARYFFDQEAVREKYQESTIARDAYGYNHAFANQFRGSPTDDRHPDGKVLPAGSFAKGPDGRRKTSVQAGDGSIQHRDGERWPNGGRNVRSVWEIATQPYAEAHFATYPQELVRRCLLAGCPEWVCGMCGKPRERIVDGQRIDTDGSVVTGALSTDAGRSASAGARPVRVTPTLGWSDCGHGNYQPGTVLDPFLGSGTTALVARNHGRRSIGIELNADYCALAARRLSQQSLLAGDAA